MTNRAKPTVSDAFRLQLQVLVTVLGKNKKNIMKKIYKNNVYIIISDLV